MTLLSLTTVVGIMTHMGVLEKVDLQILWYVSYVISIIYVIRRVQLGLFFEPIVLLPSSYLFLIVAGTIAFAIIKGRDYNFYLSNLVGMGYLALFAGLTLSQLYTYSLGCPKPIRRAFQMHAMRSRPLFYAALGISTLASVLLFIKGGVPMLAADVNQARLDLISENGYLNLFFIGLTVLCLAFLYDCLTMQRSKKRLLGAHLLAVIVSVMLFMTGYRARTIIFIGEYAGILFFFRRKRFSLKLIATLGLLFVFFLAGVGAYRRGAADLSSVANEIGIILASRPAIFELIIHNFDQSNYFHGSRYFYDLQKLLPGNQSGANVDLKYEIFPNADKMPELAGITPSIIGEAYMNFGPTGIFWVMLFLGIVLGASYKYMKARPSFVKTVFYFTLVLGMTGAVQSGIGTKVMQLIYLWLWLVVSGILYERKITV